MYYIFLFLTLLTYLLCFHGIDVLPVNDSFQYISMTMYIIMFIWFFIRNRKKSIFCPELFILFTGFLISFFDILILNNVGFISSFFNQFSSVIQKKSTCLSLIGFCTFILGEEFGKKFLSKKKIRRKLDISIPAFFATMMHYISLTAVILVFLTGQHIGFMKYTLEEEGESTNMINIMISIVIMVSSVLEFIRLNKLNQSPQSFSNFILKINKVYVISVVIWSLFLLLTGNRGDMMLIAMPPIILFHHFIHKFSNKTVMLGVVIGSFIMMFVGLTRQGEADVSNTVSDFGVYALFRDYGPAYVNQQGLIKYTDSYGTYGYSSGAKAIISGIPFLGSILLSNTQSTSSEGNTNKLSTEQWRLSDTGGGLGTSLLGDLYYAGGIFFVLFYMFFLGLLLSYAYERLFNDKGLNLIFIFIYCWLFSDSLYILRAPYYHLFRQIGFSLIIIFVLYVLSINDSTKYRHL